MEAPTEEFPGLLNYQIGNALELKGILQRKGIALNCSDTGTGKTYIMAALARNLGLNLFVLTPKAGVRNIFSTCESLGASVLGVSNYECIQRGKYYTCLENFYQGDRTECEYVDMIYTTMKHPLTGKIMYEKNGKAKTRLSDVHWNFPERTLIVFDEAHKCRNGKCSGKETINSRLLTSIKSSVNLSRQVYCLLMSATITDKLENFDVIAYMLGLYKPYNPKIYEQYLRRLGNDSETVLQRIHNTLFPEYASRTSKSDTGDYFQKNDVCASVYNIDVETGKRIESIHSEIHNSLNELRSKGLSVGWGLIIRLWQRIEVLKVPLVADLAIQYLRERKAVAVFVNFTETKKLLAEKIVETAPDLIDMTRIDFIEGGQGETERDDIVDAFQNNQIDLLICNIRAGGTAISLHDVSGKQRVSLIFPTWSATDLKQALGRIHRSMSQSDAIQRIVYCKHVPDALLPQDVDDNIEGPGTLSVEEKLCDTVNNKLENIELINTGDLIGCEIDFL
jgi:superfamily II DNA or RNA helicase